MSVNKRVVHKINEILKGGNSKRQEHMKVLQQEYIHCLEDTLLKLDFDSNLFGNFKPHDWVEWIERNIKMGTKCATWQGEYNKVLDVTFMAAINDIQKELSNLKAMQILLRFMISMENIHELNEKLHCAMLTQDNVEMLHLYLQIYESEDSKQCIVGRMNIHDPPTLLTYAREVAAVWYTRIKNTYTKELQIIMETLRIIDEDNMLKIIYDDTNLELNKKAQLMANLLFTLQSPKKDLEPDLIIIEPGIICPPLSVVVSVLLEPYRKRFQFDFSGKRKTNRLDKPEWMYTQLINWAKNGFVFMSETFQQCAIEAGQLKCNIKLEFLQGLMMLAMQKVSHDLDVIVRDNNLFAHLIDETLSYEAEMRGICGYPDTFPSVITVLSSPKYLPKWLALEEDFCEKSLDDILKDKDAWQILEMPEDTSVMIPRCVDRCMQLLDGIKGRYFSLIQPGQKLQFLNVQLSVLDSFRRRMVQMYNQNLIYASSVLNAVNYIILVLRDWGENVHYLHLHVALKGNLSGDISSVFDTPISELESWRDTMVKTYATNIFSSFRASCFVYVCDCWYDKPLQDVQALSVSPSSFDFFMNLAINLNSLHNDISTNMFNEIARQLAKHVDDYIFEEFILFLNFSAGGIQQFEYDMKRNLFPLFGHYINAPHLIFKKIHNALILLTASKGTAILIHATLTGQDNMEKKKSVLEDFNIQFLDVKTCILVLEGRYDIKAIIDAA